MIDEAVMRVGLIPKLAAALLCSVILGGSPSFALDNAGHGGALVEGEATGVVAQVKAGGGPATTITEDVSIKNQIPMLNPKSDGAMRIAEQKYSEIADRGGFPVVPNGTYKKGSKGEGVAALNQRLFMEGYVRIEATQGNFATIYTSATQDAVSKFQRNRGLAVTGKVDKTTLKYSATRCLQSRFGQSLFGGKYTRTTVGNCF
jgi:Putative peptidoglycan binding domain